MPLFDTHAHLDDPQLAPDIERWLDLARQHDLIGIAAIATNAETSQSCLQLALQQDLVWASAGVHPNGCHQANEYDWRLVEELAGHDKVVAIGETGLDLYWKDCPIETQRVWFAKHLELSARLNKPVVVHMRECESEILAALKPFSESGPIRGIMHSFTGSWETAQQCLDWGMYISFAGMVTFKKSNELREVAARVPSDRLLVETDAPYLTPHPERGKRPNHPAMVRHTATCLADVRGVSVDELSDVTTCNAKKVFGLEHISF